MARATPVRASGRCGAAVVDRERTKEEKRGLEQKQGQ